MPNSDRERTAILEEKQRNDESDIEELREEIRSINKRLSYYDRMAAKYMGIALGVIGIGALLSGHFDKIREKIIDWLP